MYPERCISVSDSSGSTSIDAMHGWWWCRSAPVSAAGDSPGGRSRNDRPSFSQEGSRGSWGSAARRGSPRASGAYAAARARFGYTIRSTARSLCLPMFFLLAVLLFVLLKCRLDGHFSWHLLNPSASLRIYYVQLCAAPRPAPAGGGPAFRLPRPMHQRPPISTEIARPHDAPAVRDGGPSRDPENRPGDKGHPLQRQLPRRAGSRNDVPSEAVSRRNAGEGRSLRPRRPSVNILIPRRFRGLLGPRRCYNTRRSIT